MSTRNLLASVAILLTVATGLFYLFERQFSSAWLALGLHPEVLAALDRSLEDQKRLADLDAERREEFRLRFEEVDTLRKRLRILEHNRQAIGRRFQLVLIAAFVLLLGATAAAYALQKLSERRRLERLRGALEDLCAGRSDIRLEEKRRDAIGRVAEMIEGTSRVLATQRRRLHALENLSAWQEAARRHAHEMRTPLTAARLEVERLTQVADGLGAEGAPVTDVAGSLAHELDRLAAFTRRFTSFARLPQPRPVRQDLAVLAAEFVRTFESAWAGLKLTLDAPEPGASHFVDVDREMLRQVLVNLCDNSAHAVVERGGEVGLRVGSNGDAVTLEVADNGPGIAAEVRRRLFEPYATTRRVGEGMGLGLAISKKILLDHGGDLELAESSATGTTFRLTFPGPRAAPLPEDPP